MILKYSSILILHLLAWSVTSDTIADCRFEDFIGHWRIDIFDYAKDCNQVEDPNLVHTTEVIFEYPNIVKNRNNIEGSWTMIYNQGAELEINNRRYLLLNWYNSTHYSCEMSIAHWTYISMDEDWYCAKAKKLYVPIKYHSKKTPPYEFIDETRLYKNDEQYVRHLNKIHKTWWAKSYPHDETYTIKEIVKSRGTPISRYSNDFKKYSTKEPITREIKQKINNLPEEFDWRTIKHPSGQSYVSPVRAQLHCGSCYAFASLAAAEARVRIVTNMTETPIFSTQDIVDCSAYSQGCDGGFPYLIAGKYGHDFGLVEEECNPYQAKETGSCSTKKSCKRYYFTNYGYIGGYDGATTEDAMKLELIENGPFPVSIMAYPDLKKYSGGIYIHKETDYQNRFDPFEATNHVVVIVGYGFDKKLNLPFWIVKNSWGSDWGEKGFFRVLRGHDEIGIESLAVRFDYAYY